MKSIKFTEIPERLKYNLTVRGRLSTMHSAVVSYVTNHYNGTHRQKQNIINVMNTLSYMIVSNDTIPDTWKPETPLIGITIIDDDQCQRMLGDMYIAAKSVVWDLEIISDDAPTVIEPKIIEQPNKTSVSEVIATTPKEDLYLQSPAIPRFDYQHPYASRMVNGMNYVVYPSLPVIPTRQCEISATTDIDKMTSRDLLNLYPNALIKTRFISLYNAYPNMEYDDILGTILPIEGYTLEQLRENIIKYPHIYKLSKVIDDKIVPFYSKIEIDGELYDISAIWWQLPESHVIPYAIDLVKEYVVRRYLLERDIKHIDHKYPIFGGLESFITLFAPADNYEAWGYDKVETARACVQARVNYKRNRNPLLRGFDHV